MPAALAILQAQVHEFLVVRLLDFLSQFLQVVDAVAVDRNARSVDTVVQGVRSASTRSARDGGRQIAAESVREADKGGAGLQTLTFAVDGMNFGG